MRPCFAHCNGTNVSSGIPRTPIKLEAIGVDPLFLTSVLIAVIWHESTQHAYSTTYIQMGMYTVKLGMFCTATLSASVPCGSVTADLQSGDYQLV